MESATFPADCAYLFRISEFVNNYAQKLPFTPKQIYEIDLAVDEASSNIIDHAYKGLPEGEIRIFLDHSRTAMTINLQDDGIGFDLNGVPKPDLTGPLEERRERGLGVFLIHELMDQVTYEPNTGKGNQITLVKNFDSIQPETPVQRDSASLPLETLRIISEINRSISSTLDLDQLLQDVTRLIHKQFGYPLVHIYLVDYVPQTTVFKAGSGEKAAIYAEDKVTYPINVEPGLIALTARTGKTQISNDISIEPNYRPDAGYDSMKGSELTLPLQFQGQMLGVLDIQSDKTNAFTNLDVEQLEILSQSISIAIRNANLYRTSVWHRNLVERYRETAERVSRNVDPEELICYVIEQIPTILPVDFIGFWKKNEDANGLSLKDYWCRQPEICQPDVNQHIENDVWFAQISNKNNGMIKPAEITNDPVQDCLNLEPSFSAVASPISYQKQGYGVLTFHTASAGRYGQDSLNICSTFADYVGTALDKQRVEAEKDKQAWLTSILLDLANETTNLTTLDELTYKIGKILIELIGGVSVGLVLETENPDIVSLPSLYCPQVQCPLAQLPLNFERKALIGPSSQVPHLSVARTGDFPELLELLPLRSDGTILIFPLQAQEQTLGYLLHLSNDVYRQAAPEDILDKDRFSILQGISQQAAISLQNIQMLDDRKEENRLSLRLLEIGNILTQAEDFDAGIYDASMRIAAECDLEKLALLVFQPDEKNYVLKLLLSREPSGDFVPVKRGRVFTVNEIEDNIKPEKDLGQLAFGDELFCKDIGLKRDSSSTLPDKTMVFPMEIGQEFYGFLLVCDDEFKFNQRRIGYLTRVSRQIAVAFQNRRMRSIEQQRRQTEQELTLARRIQKTFLPEKLPEIPGYQLSVEWQTARQVGGDFYDVISFGDGRFGMLVADVSDKGLPASLYMTVSQTLIRAVSREFTSPAQTLEQVNHLLQLDSTQSFFVTLIYMILDTRNGKLTYSIAGHNPPYILDPIKKTAVLLPKGGIALGLMEPIELKDVELELRPKQSIVLYTDGLSESTNTNGKEYGQERLQQTLIFLAQKPPEIIITDLLQDLENFQGGDFFEDDRTLLVLKRN
jgi:serine phosphatase RsbU (regulator of sigma subunit)/anti-sigma regulatory factor (Ser/Thr protein kinase)/putative methionine-R-sulfoxide reductase with GAF domain